MANPKRRHTHSRGAKRRTHYKLDAPGLSRCKQCGELHLPHRACPSCGYYRGRRYAEAMLSAETEE
ncbi:MAG: 50S ribosomal protein L32 [Fimbriimonadales bacterium]|nr:50S ribosomal protein L32 [Fimbriimonadales bacterium]